MEIVYSWMLILIIVLMGYGTLIIVLELLGMYVNDQITRNALYNNLISLIMKFFNLTSYLKYL